MDDPLLRLTVGLLVSEALLRLWLLPTDGIVWGRKVEGVPVSQPVRLLEACLGWLTGSCCGGGGLLW